MLRQKGVGQFVQGETPKSRSQTLCLEHFPLHHHTDCSHRENRRFDITLPNLLPLQRSSPLVCFQIFLWQDVLGYRIWIHTNLQADFKLKCISKVYPLPLPLGNKYLSKFNWILSLCTQCVALTLSEIIQKLRNSGMFSEARKKNQVYKVGY